MPTFTVYQAVTAVVTLANESAAPMFLSIVGELGISKLTTPEQTVAPGAKGIFLLPFTMPSQPQQLSLLLDVLGRYEWDAASAVVAKYVASEPVTVQAPSVGISVGWK